MARVQAAGPTAKALWGSAAVRLPAQKLHKLRLAQMRAIGKLPRGVSVGLRLRAVQARGFLDPASRHHRDVILQWATSIWESYPPMPLLQDALDGAKARTHKSQSPWLLATGPAAAFLLTANRVGWQAQSARFLVTDSGQQIDLLHLAPKAVAALTERASERWSDRQALARAAAGEVGFEIFWTALQPLLSGKPPLSWSREHRQTLVHVLSGGEWPQARQHDREFVDSDRCQLCEAG